MPSDMHRVPLQWSVFADRLLRQRARTMDAVTLASSLGRTPMEVRARALALGVELMGEVDVMDRAWGSGEVSFLRQQYRRMTPAEIGRQLGRSAGAVRHKLQSLGLRKALDPKPEALQGAPVWAPEPMEPEPVPLVEAVERRMEREAEPESAPWKESEQAASKWAELELEPESADLPAPGPATSKWAEIEPEPQMPAEAPERPAEAVEETGAGKCAGSVSERASAAVEPFRWWTADEDERLRQLVKDRTPLAELAGLFGRAEDEVRRRIARVCAEPDPAGQAGSRKWGWGSYGRKQRLPRAKPAGPIPEASLASMSKMDVLRALAGLA